MISRCDEIIELHKVFGASGFLHEIAAPSIGRSVADAIEQVEVLCGPKGLGGGIRMGYWESHGIDGHTVGPPKIASAILKGRIAIAAILGHIEATRGNGPLVEVDVHVGRPSTHGIDSQKSRSDFGARGIRACLGSRLSSSPLPTVS